MVDRDYDTKAYEDGVRAGRQEMQAEIERLKAEVETWVGHTKTAVWSDSEQCKMLEAEIERLRAALETIKKMTEPQTTTAVQPVHVPSIHSIARHALRGQHE